MPDDDILVWFRRDLRIDDHAALSHALRDARRVHCVFVFDTGILDALENRADRRVEFIWESVRELNLALERAGGGLHVLHGQARELIPALAVRLGAAAVYLNHDYEPDANARDEEVRRRLQADGRSLRTFKDQVVFEKSEILTADGRPYTVFTPYRRAWLARLEPARVEPHAVNLERSALAPAEQSALPELEAMNFRRSNLRALKMPVGMTGARELFQDFLSRIDLYRDRRDYPGVRGVSYLSAHLRFGTVSIRELVRTAASVGTPGAETWLSELIWREFYFSILHHFPHVTDRAFRPEYDAVQFENREEYFRAWCEARTGFPLVDAAMRQINSTGYMHNRLRMVAASFLVKDLHVDWRWGERYFAANLNDFDLAANNGGWQWCASTGCDAQPYFRIFNPVTQSKKFDPQGRFIRMYLPELSKVADEHVHEPWKMNSTAQRAGECAIGRDYPAPIVDHDTARKKTLQMYSLARQGRR